MGLGTEELRKEVDVEELLEELLPDGDGDSKGDWDSIIYGCGASGVSSEEYIASEVSEVDIESEVTDVEEL